LATAVTALPAVDELILDWNTMGYFQQPLQFFRVAWEHLAPRIRKLTLRTNIFNLPYFTSAAELQPTMSLEEIHVEIRGRNSWNDLRYDIQLARAADTHRGLSTLAPLAASSSSTLKEFTVIIDREALQGFSATLSELSAVDLPHLLRLTVLCAHNNYGRSAPVSHIAHSLCSMIQSHASTLEELTLNWLSDPNQIKVWLQSGRLPRLRKLVLYNDHPSMFGADGIRAPSVPTLGRWFSSVPTLQDLSIRGLILGEEQLLFFVPALAQCPALHTIDLRYHQLTVRVYDELLRACPSLATLKCRERPWLKQIPPPSIIIDTRE
jgi:hypothetical protein